MNSPLLAWRTWITGLAVTSIIASPFVLDFTLTARFITLAATLFLFFLFIPSKKINSFELTPLILAYVAYVLFALISISWANTKSEAIFDVSKLILAFAVFLTAGLFMKERPSFFEKSLLRLPAVVFSIGFIVLLYQLNHLKNFTKESMYELTGINGHKNLYSSFIFLNLFFLGRNLFQDNKKWKIISIICIILSVGILILLRTKAAWLGIGTVVLFCACLYPARKLDLQKLNFYVTTFLLLVIINLFFFFALQPLVEKTIKRNAEIIKQDPTSRQKTELDNERLVLWDKTYNVFKEHPFAGTGAGNWQIFYPNETLRGLWRAEDMNFTFQRPHNDFLWILSETGIIGFNLFLFFLIALVVVALKGVRIYEYQKPAQLELILGIAFLLGYLVISFFDFPKERIAHLSWSNLLFALLYHRASQAGALPAFKTVHIAEIRPLALLILAFVLLTGILRYKGEFYTRKMYDQRNLSNYSGVIDLAEKAGSFAYAIDPTSIPLSWFTGNAHASLQNYTAAQKDFEKAYRLNPYNRNVVNDLASSYAFTGNKEMAKKLYIETSRISPRFDEAKLNLAAIYIQEQKFSEASTVLDSIYHDSERRTQYRNMVNALIKK